MPNPRVRQVSRLLHRTTQHAEKTPFTQEMVARVRAPLITTSKADFVPRHSAKTKQAWRYNGGNILRAPSLLINGKRYEDPKDPGQARRKQESNFFITINSNKSPEPGESFDVCVRHMEQMLRMLSTETAMAQYFKFGPVDATYSEDRYYDVIDNTDWKANVETGDKQHRLHAHIWLTVTHYSQIQMNVHALQYLARSYYNEGFPLGLSALRIGAKPYVNVRLLPQSDFTTVFRQYIHKGMTGFS